MQSGCLLNCQRHRKIKPACQAKMNVDLRASPEDVRTVRFKAWLPMLATGQCLSPAARLNEKRDQRANFSKRERKCCVLTLQGKLNDNKASIRLFGCTEDAAYLINITGHLCPLYVCAMPRTASQIASCS